MAPSHYSNRPRRPRKPDDPVLMGEPSPALTKIARMNTEKLTAHIETMKLEMQRLETKIGNLSNMTPPDEARIATLKDHRARLNALMDAARERFAGKLERSKERGSTGYRR